MFHRLRDKANRFFFDRSVREVLATEPMRVDAGSPLLLFTQLQHKDLLMGLLAFKSFARQVPVRGAAVLSDGSLTSEDRALLKEQLSDPVFVERAAFQSPQCPVGGCWERLLAVAELSEDRYVIQLDADTLTLGGIDEVAACVNANRSFALGTWDDQAVETMPFRAAEAKRHMGAGHPHVQLLSEAAFGSLRRADELKYVRGCAGYSGFARGQVQRSFIEDLSTEMFGLLGERWREWGSEQVMSNIVVANTPDAFVLPHPKFCDCTKVRQGTTAFIHFIGSCRFSSDRYRLLARRTIAELKRT
jgi:hypothetical protein